MRPRILTVETEFKVFLDEKDIDFSRSIPARIP